MPKLNLRGSRRGASRARGFLIVLMLFLVVMSRARSSRRHSTQPVRDNAAQSATAEPAGKYVPAGDEGLGASIALVLDVSGSMGDKAEGDSRPKYLVARE